VTLERLAKDADVSTPYIVGGLPRDKVIGIPAKAVKDIDITTGDKGSLALAMSATNEWPEANFRMYDDGHSSLSFKNIQMDFSNNFKVPGITAELKKMGIKDPSEMQKEIYSRDFTINTLLQPMDITKDPLDITGKGIEDIKNRLLRTPIDPDLTIGYDPRRILRAIKLAVKFGFEIDPELGKTLIKYRGSVKSISLNHIKKQINEMLKMDSEKTIDLLSKYKLLPIIPLSKLMQLEVVKNKMVQHILDA
jgi:tRNA nucleotidyltransferase/poly(A) polymerase